MLSKEIEEERLNKLSKEQIHNKNNIDNTDNILPPTLSRLFLLVLFIYIIFSIRIYDIKINTLTNVNPIQIALNIDNRYIYPCLVLLTSLLDNQANTSFYIIHILIGEKFAKRNIHKIKSLLRDKGSNNTKLNFYKIGDDFNRATHGYYISVADYYRIALPSLLPDVDKIIYIDTDIINFKDLSEMYSINFEKNIYFKGTLDQIGLITEIRHRNVKKYINAGVLLMNLKLIREDGIEKQLRDYIKTHHLNHHDQTALNNVCYNNLGVLSIKYASFVFNSFDELLKFNKEQSRLYRYRHKELEKAFYDPTLLHYVGYVKPWHKSYNKINGEYWWYYAKKSGFYEEILRYYRFKRRIVDEVLNKMPENGGLLKRNINFNE